MLKRHIGQVLFSSALLLVALFGTSGVSYAAGCMKGAVVGGVAGHYAHHHAVVGAIGGCIVGHHMAKKHAEAVAAARQNDAAHHLAQ